MDVPHAVSLQKLNRREILHSAACIMSGNVARRLFPGMGDLHDLPVMADASDFANGDRIANTPARFYRPYRSKDAGSADAISWVQIDLGKIAVIDSIRIYPSNQLTVGGGYSGGLGFPVRFKIQTSRRPDFIQAELVTDFTGVDFKNPKDYILNFPGPDVTARYVRLTVTKFAPPVDYGKTKGQYLFALSKIGVLAAGRDIAIGAVVTCDDQYGNVEDLAQLTRADRIETEYVHHDRPEQVTGPESWRRVQDLVHVPRSGVELHGGIFESAMRRNIAYLLSSFSNDELLLQFRERAGKEIPPGVRKPDQFWESNLAGSNAGRFLMGAGNTLRWIEDRELRSRCDAVVEGIAQCREPNGYIMAYPEDTMFFSERGAYTRAWVTHGLIEAGYGGNPKAFELLRGNYDWFNQNRYLPDLLRGAIQGGQGMIANTRMYFTPVGKDKDIQVIQQFFLEEKWLAAIDRKEQDQIWQYPYDHPHCYLLTNLEAYFDVYRATGDTRWHDAVKAGWEMFNEHWEHTGGAISIIEGQYDPPDSNYLTQRQGELCGSSFWTFLSQRFQMLYPSEERYATEIEKSIYNVALANLDGESGFRGYTILVGKKSPSGRVNGCCEGQGTRLIGSLPEHIYSIADDGLYVNLFEASSISWTLGPDRMKLTMNTKFPFENEVELIISTERQTHMRLRLRVPSWSRSKMAVAINEEVPVLGKPGSYLEIERAWVEGDVVRFKLSPEFVTIKYTGQDQIPGRSRYALMYGPLLYAAVGSKDAALRILGSRAEDIAKQLKQKPSDPLHYSIAANPEITYVPYWQVAGEEEFTCFPAFDLS
jgi:uncharacterized protein